MTAYYNECDPKAAAWLRELISADVIVRGEVDERDIRDVTPADLVGFTQCHFFAGIGGWPYALRLAGWPDTKEVWTGSCPCQPFSAAGKRTGTFDERHLWPAWHWLINARRPPLLFGEQVASPDGLTWLDLVQADLEGSSYQVEYADLCAAGVGAPHIRQRLFWVAEPSVRRQHNQQGVSGFEEGPGQRRSQSIDGCDNDRLAQSPGQRRQGVGLHVQPGTSRVGESEVGRGCQVGVPMGDAGSPGLSQRVGDGGLQRETLDALARQTPIGPGDAVDVDLAASGGFTRLGDQPAHVQSVQADSTDDAVAEPESQQPHGGRNSRGGRGEPPDCCDLRHVADPHGVSGGQGGPQSRGRDRGGHEESGPGLGGGELLGELGHSGCNGARQHARELSSDEREHEERPPQRDYASVAAGPVGDVAHADGRDAGSERIQRSGQHGLLAQDRGVGFWDDCIWLPCRDGKARPVEPGTFPLAHGVSGRVGLLRGYGNAIVPQVAAEFIAAYLDSLGD